MPLLDFAADMPPPRRSRPPLPIAACRHFRRAFSSLRRFRRIAHCRHILMSRQPLIAFADICAFRYAAIQATERLRAAAIFQASLARCVSAFAILLRCRHFTPLLMPNTPIFGLLASFLAFRPRFFISRQPYAAAIYAAAIFAGAFRLRFFQSILLSPLMRRH